MYVVVERSFFQGVTVIDRDPFSFCPDGCRRRGINNQEQLAEILNRNLRPFGIDNGHFTCLPLYQDGDAKCPQGVRILLPDFPDNLLTVSLTHRTYSQNSVRFEVLPESVNSPLTLNRDNVFLTLTRTQPFDDFVHPNILRVGLIFNG